MGSFYFIFDMARTDAKFTRPIMRNRAVRGWDAIDNIIDRLGSIPRGVMFLFFLSFQIKGVVRHGKRYRSKENGRL